MQTEICFQLCEAVTRAGIYCISPAGESGEKEGIPDRTMLPTLPSRSDLRVSLRNQRE